MAVTLKGAEALKFIQALGHNDAFRAKLETHPKGALEDLGIKVPPGTALPKPNHISSKWTVANLAWPQPQKFVPWFGTNCPIKLELP
jgi:hypothetical protein